MHVFQNLTNSEAAAVAEYDECTDPDVKYKQKDIDFLIELLVRLDSELSMELCCK